MTLYTGIDLTVVSWTGNVGVVAPRFNTIASIGSLGGASIRQITSDPNGQLWCVNQSNQICYWNSSNQAFSTWDEANNVSVSSIAFDATSNMWVTLVNGVLWTISPSGTYTKLGSSLQWLDFDQYGNNWCVSSTGLVGTWDNSNQKFVQSDVITANQASGVSIDPNDNVWIVNNDGSVDMWNQVNGLVYSYETLGGWCASSLYWGGSNPAVINYSSIYTSLNAFGDSLNSNPSLLESFQNSPVSTMIANGVPLSVLTDEQLTMLNDLFLSEGIKEDYLFLIKMRKARIPSGSENINISSCDCCYAGVCVVIAASYLTFSYLAAGIFALLDNVIFANGISIMFGVALKSVLSAFVAAARSGNVQNLPDLIGIICQAIGYCLDNSALKRPDRQKLRRLPDESGATC